MKTQLVNRIVRGAALLLVLAALVFSSQLSFASPAQDGGKNGTAGKDSPAAAYQLYGDKTNSVGSGATVFNTTGAGDHGAWEFKGTGGGYIMGTTCSTADCNGIYVSAAGVGINAISQNATAGTSSNNPAYGVKGSINGEGPYAVGVYGHGIHDSGIQIGVKGETKSPDGIGVSGVSVGTGVYAETTGQGAYALYALASNTNAVGGIYGESKQGNGITGQAYGNSSDNSHVAGVSGKMTAPSADPAKHSGVYGQCLVCSGVTGRTDSYIGVRGFTTGSATTAYGGYFSATVGIGLYGQSDSNYGVYGRSSSKYGVYGKSDSSYAVLGISGTGYGVYGKSNDSYGVYATTVNGNIALRAVQPNSGAGTYAGYFDGNVQVNGNLTCSGGCVAAMAVNTDKGEKLVYADSSAQSVVNDQGTATLKNGRAIVKIDPLFAQTVALGSGYQVFAMPGSADTAGLAVINKTATSFEIVELGKGKGNFSFDWRISALRKGHEAERLAPAPARIADATK